MAEKQFNFYKDYLETANTLKAPIPQVYYLEALVRYGLYKQDPAAEDPIHEYPDAKEAFEKTKVLIDTRK